MSIRDALVARRQESDPAETWELPFSESEGGSYYQIDRASSPYTPRRVEDVQAGALESFWEMCGIEDLHQVFIIPWAVCTTGARGQKVTSPNSVLALGARAVGLWTEKPQPGARVVIELGELAAMKDVTILLYGRLSFYSTAQRLRIRYNTVTRIGLEPALLELRRRLTGPAQRTPRDDLGAPALPFKWDRLLHTPGSDRTGMHPFHSGLPACPDDLVGLRRAVNSWCSIPMSWCICATRLGHPTQREELMRPSRFLGYDRDSLGMYAMTKEIFGVAESQFRRSVYLNPYEPRFKQHLAWCLHKEGTFEEAGEWIEKTLAQRPDDNDSRVILSKIHERMAERRQRATGGTNAEEGI